MESTYTIKDEARRRTTKDEKTRSAVAVISQSHSQFSKSSMLEYIFDNQWIKSS